MIVGRILINACNGLNETCTGIDRSLDGLKSESKARLKLTERQDRLIRKMLAHTERDRRLRRRAEQREQTALKEKDQVAAQLRKVKEVLAT